MTLQIAVNAPSIIIVCKNPSNCAVCSFFIENLHLRMIERFARRNFLEPRMAPLVTCLNCIYFICPLAQKRKQIVLICPATSPHFPPKSLEQKMVRFCRLRLSYLCSILSSKVTHYQCGKIAAAQATRPKISGSKSCCTQYLVVLLLFYV